MAYLEAGTYYFQAGPMEADRPLVPAGGSTVEVSVWSGTDYVVDSDSPISSPATVYTRSNRIRLVATGGFFFATEELDSVAN